MFDWVMKMSSGFTFFPWHSVDCKWSKYVRHVLLHKASFDDAFILSSNNAYHYGNSWLQIFRPAYKLTPDFQGKKLSIIL